MMKEGKNKLNEELLAKFLMGECSEEELREVNTWLNESDDNARELFRIEEIIWERVAILQMRKKLKKQKNSYSNGWHRKKLSSSRCVECILG